MIDRFLPIVFSSPRLSPIFLSFQAHLFSRIGTYQISKWFIFLNAFELLKSIWMDCLYLDFWGLFLGGWFIMCYRHLYLYLFCGISDMHFYSNRCHLDSFSVSYLSRSFQIPWNLCFFIYILPFYVAENITFYHNITKTWGIVYIK